jgi:arylsulfatase A-like enzyme
MRMTWMVSGPNVRRGAVIDRPCRGVDLLPTILEMAGVPFVPDEMDGRPLRQIYVPPASLPVTMTSWQDDAGIPPQVPNALTPALSQQEKEYAAAPDLDVAWQPVFWHDVDLGAWQPLSNQFRPEYPQDWIEVHRFDNPWDLHNLLLDVASISDWEVLRLGDRFAGMFHHDRPLGRHFDEFGADLDVMALTSRRGRGGRCPTAFPCRPG